MHRRRRFQKVIKYDILFPAEILSGSSPIASTTTRQEAKVEVSWDEKKTIVTQAKLQFVGHSRNDAAFLPPWGFPVSMDAHVYCNDALILTAGWYTDFGCNWRESASDATAYLKNGWNKFELELIASAHPLTVGIDGVHVTLEVWFEGEEPDIKGEEPEWMKYLKWGLIGLGAVGAVFVSLKAVEIIKKK